MSYDIWLEADLGGPEPVSLSVLEANYTYNVSPMFMLAIGSTPNDWDRMNAAEIAGCCDGILAAFDLEPDKFRALNPKNGWGDFDGARAFIATIRDACLMAPKATVRTA